MARFCEIKTGEPIREPDHVLVVKHDEGRYEVTGTAGASACNARFLTPEPFEDKDRALTCAQAFADENGLRNVYIKGFLIAPEKP